MSGLTKTVKRSRPILSAFLLLTVLGLGSVVLHRFAAMPMPTVCGF